MSSCSGQRRGASSSSLVPALDLFAWLPELPGGEDQIAAPGERAQTWMDARGGRGREVAVAETRWLFEADRSAAILDAEGWKLIRYPGGRRELFFLSGRPRRSGAIIPHHGAWFGIGVA